ncbi:MAG: hypothetical protein BSK19_07600 [Stenotrophomonas maltophilia]|nr:MAG: hypothetical protein BSK19_07600 [Stenotrophomonas maltophilia]
MMDRTNTYAGSVRRLFEAAPKARLRMRDLCALAKADTVEHRGRVRSAVRDLVVAGFLIKDGSGQRAEYQHSGRGMRRQFVITAEQQAQFRANNATKEAARRAAKRGTAVDKMTINRARVDLRADLAPAKPWGKEKAGQAPAETVVQFQARGGQVQRLTASWEQVA